MTYKEFSKIIFICVTATLIFQIQVFAFQKKSCVKLKQKSTQQAAPVLPYTVELPRKVAKQMRLLPKDIQMKVHELSASIVKFGPVQGNWPNYSKLSTGKNVHHCHLKYHYIALWEVVDKQKKIIRIIHVGTRQNAPY